MNNRQIQPGTTTSHIGINQSITLEWNKVITITKRTVRFSKNVYQTHNITGFGEGEVDIGTMPWWIIIICFIIGSLIKSFTGENSFASGTTSDGVVLWLYLAAIGGGIWNVAKPKHYGFMLTLNSGDKKLFITTDKKGLQKVISVIYDVIESEKEATYQITISNSQIEGNFIQGYAGGDVSFNSD